MDLAVVLQNAQHPCKYICFIHDRNITHFAALEIRNQAEAYLNQYAETKYVSMKFD